MSLVYDDEVKTTDREVFLVRIDIPDHSLIGTECDAGIHIRTAVLASVLVVVENACRLLRQQFGKVLLSLRDKCGTVGQKKDVLCPFVSEENIAKRNGDARLS